MQENKINLKLEIGLDFKGSNPTPLLRNLVFFSLILGTVGGMLLS